MVSDEMMTAPITSEDSFGTQDAPRVSVIIPVYNRAPLIGRAIESVIAQSAEDWELIVVDDGSTDETPSVVEDYRSRLGPRLIHLRRARGGSSAARNTGIDRARGEFIAFLDSDDEFRRNKLARQLELFEQEPGLGFVFSDYAFVDLEGVHHPSAFDGACPLARRLPVRQIAPKLLLCTGDLADYMLRGYFISTIVGMVRRSVVGESVRFLEGQWYSEEWLFYLEVAKRCRSGYVDEPLSLHHRVAGSVSHTSVPRNLLNQQRLLSLLAQRFPDCSRPARRALRSLRSTCARQLGWNAMRADLPTRALRHFGEALIHQPTLPALRPVIAAAWRVLTQPRLRPETPA
ncbi:MAG: glycosyltransferase family 2 protein [bacterium]|nr:glycosyltransferase family 2 protein [bacterium]